VEEVRVPLDLEARVERLDADVARRAGLFTDIAGFRTAQLFQQPDSSWVLEIEIERDGRLVRDRRPLDAAGVAALRQDVSTRLAAPPAFDAEDRRGEPLLLAGSAVLGLAFYDWAIPSATDLDDKTAVATGMLAAAGAFFVPWLLTRNEVVTPGMANMALYGGTRGIVHGMLVHEMINADRVDYDDGDGRLLGGVIGSVVEATGGYFWARETQMTAARSHAIGVGGDFGLVIAMGVAEIFDSDDTALDSDEPMLFYASGLAGAAAGMAGGNWIESRRRWSWGDVEVARMAGLVGGAAGIAAADLADTADDDWWIASGITGGLAGLVVGDRVVADTQYDGGDAMLVDVGAIAGAALGMGIAYLLDQDDSDSAAYTSAAALGAAGGYAILCATTRGDATRHADAGAPSWRVDLDPLGVWGAVRSSKRTTAAPIVRLSARF
jgi:hypothetical protein